MTKKALRLGPPSNLRRGGAMDPRPKRQRTRGAQLRAALKEQID